MVRLTCLTTAPGCALFPSRSCICVRIAGLGHFQSSRPLWMTRILRQSPSTRRVLPATAHSMYHDYTWTSNLNGLGLTTTDLVSTVNRSQHDVNPSVLKSAMRLVASRPAPALLSSPARRHVHMKEEIRHEAMSLVLAGIVATMVLATFKGHKSGSSAQPRASEEGGAEQPSTATPPLPSALASSKGQTGTKGTILPTGMEEKSAIQGGQPKGGPSESVRSSASALNVSPTGRAQGSTPGPMAAASDDKPGAVPNQPGASSDEAEATLDRSGAERDMGQASSSMARASPKSPGASSSSPRAGEGSNEEGWKRSKQERSSSWKTGLAGGSAQTAAIAWTDMLSPQPRSNTPTRQEPALAMAGGTASVSTAGDGGSGSGGSGSGGGGGSGSSSGGGSGSSSGGGSGGGSGSNDGGDGGSSGSAVSLLVLLLGLTATGLILLRFELGQMPKRKRKQGSFPMPYAMTVLAHQANDSNLRHAAKTFKACNPIFLTQATEAERAEVLAQHKQWRMKKRLADMLQPPNAVLSHATMPAKLYRSLSQAKKRSGKVKRRSRDQVGRAATEEALAVALSQLQQHQAEAQAHQAEAAGLRADLLALRQFHLRSKALSTTGSDSSRWNSEEEEEHEALSDPYRLSRRSRSGKPGRTSLSRHASGDASHHISGDAPHHISWLDASDQPATHSSAAANTAPAVATAHYFEVRASGCFGFSSIST
ncbi:hypothetical protein WJX82_008856 [Trebouxia sp. C0006]